VRDVDDVVCGAAAAGGTFGGGGRTERDQTAHSPESASAEAPRLAAAGLPHSRARRVDDPSEPSTEDAPRRTEPTWTVDLWQPDVMATKIALYEVVDARSGEVRSRHRTRQAALDAWRTEGVGIPIQIRKIGHRSTTLIVAGIWFGRSSDSWSTGQEPEWATGSAGAISAAGVNALENGGR
jgi:hypothetical protein